MMKLDKKHTLHWYLSKKEDEVFTGTFSTLENDAPDSAFEKMR